MTAGRLGAEGRRPARRVEGVNRVKHFISLLDYTTDELLGLLDSAELLKRAFHAGAVEPALKGKRFALIWDAEGFRNRVAFEAGIQALGGSFVQVPGKLDAREPIEDVSRYLANWFDCIIARTHPHEHMIRLTRQNRVPVVNARTDYNHPCEILGDLLYIRGKRGTLSNLRVVFVGEATNLCVPWFEAAARLPIAVMQVCPKGREIDGEVLREIGRDAVGKLSTGNSLEEGLRNADVIYTDCWPRHNDDAVRKEFLPYQISAALIRRHCPEAIFLPCPPVTRGEEVSSDAMEEYGHAVFEAKEDLLHAQNAVLIHLIKQPRTRGDSLS